MFLRWCAAFGLLALASANAHATDAELETARRVAGPSVVRLTDVKGNLEMGHGSGFFVADGVVVTNHHVVIHIEDELVASFAGGKQIRVLGVLADDPIHDLALLRVEGKGYPVLTLAPSAEVHVGQRVMAIGSPLGFDQTVSSGKISALLADYPADQKAANPDDAAASGPLVMHTAATAPGSSGGPLVDEQGRVVGVHHSAIPGAEMNFAAHVDALRELIAKTDLNAKPKPLGPDIRGNLVLSGEIVALLILAWLIPTQVLAWRRRRLRH